MIPPLFRRCPECGHVGLGSRFAEVESDGRRLVECPICGARFEHVDSPVLN